ncbi:MAG: hypothetical protein AB8H86_11545 [Polyangiales bacterium]
MKPFALILLAACGTSPPPSEEAPPEPGRATPTMETREVSDEEVDERPAEVTTEAEPLPPLEGPRNFVTPHHCHPPGPCTFDFETLRGAQHIDVGHGHASPPQLDVVLRIAEGNARVEGVVATSTDEVRGTVVARPRDSLEGQAFYLTIDGEATSAEVELSFHSE